MKTDQPTTDGPEREYQPLSAEETQVWTQLLAAAITGVCANPGISTEDPLQIVDRARRIAFEAMVVWFDGRDRLSANRIPTTEREDNEN